MRKYTVLKLLAKVIKFLSDCPFTDAEIETGKPALVSDIHKAKVAKIFRSVKDYYLTRMSFDKERLAEELAKRDCQAFMFDQDEVNRLYDSLRMGA